MWLWDVLLHMDILDSEELLVSLQHTSQAKADNNTAAWLADMATYFQLMVEEEKHSFADLSRKNKRPPPFPVGSEQ